MIFLDLLINVTTELKFQMQGFIELIITVMQDTDAADSHLNV